MGEPRASDDGKKGWVRSRWSTRGAQGKWHGRCRVITRGDVDEDRPGTGDGGDQVGGGMAVKGGHRWGFEMEGDEKIVPDGCEGGARVWSC